MRTPLPDGTTDASVPTPEPPAPALRPGAHRWFVALLILGGLGLATFVTVQVLRVLGFDAVAAFRSPAPPLSMSQLPAAAPAPLAGVSAGARPAGLGPVRDHPPAVTTPKPQFTLRDGVPDSFLTDLDAETLAHLDTLNGRLDALVTATEQANAAGRHLAGTVTTQLAEFSLDRREGVVTGVAGIQGWVAPICCQRAVSARASARSRFQSSGGWPLASILRNTR